jgi:hypothetical protein
MITLQLGEILRSSVTGKVYEIKWIKDQMVILKSMEGVNQVLTWRNNLDLFYEKLPKGKGPFRNFDVEM